MRDRTAIIRPIRALPVIIVCLLAALPSVAHADPRLANRCVTLQAEAGRTGPLYVKPTTLDRVLLSDTDGRLLTGPGTTTAEPGVAAEWTVEPGPVLRAGDRTLTRPRRATGCRRFPEAQRNARGTPFRGTRRGGGLFGIADAHLHITADLRAGGRVIHGRPYDRFGIATALGGDEEDHGPAGTLDITGNLLRDGVPVGTHAPGGWPDFSGWPTFDTNTHQQAYHVWLERMWRAGLRLVAAQIVEDEPLCTIEPIKSHSCDETETVKLGVERLRGLQDYVDAQSGGRGRGWLRLVSDPRAARRAIRAGKLAVVIGVESSNPFGCSQVRGVPECTREDVDRGIALYRRLGISGLFIAHWVDNAFGGAALEGGDKGLFISALQVVQTGSFFATTACPEPGQGEEPATAAPEQLGPLADPIAHLLAGNAPVYPPGRQCNRVGLTPLGEYAVGRLMDEHMLIEADHLAEGARLRLLEIAERRRYPLVSSHTHTGGTWSESTLRRLAALGGFASVTSSSAGEMAAATGRLRGLGFGAVGLGTDTGGFATLPGPPDAEHRIAYPFRSYDGRVTFERQRTGTRTFDYNADGVAHYGLFADLLADMSARPGGRTALKSLFGSAEAYLRTWERTGR